MNTIKIHHIISGIMLLFLVGATPIVIYSDNIPKVNSDPSTLGFLITAICCVISFIMTLIVLISVRRKNIKKSLRMIQKREIFLFCLATPTMTLLILMLSMDIYTKFFGVTHSTITVQVLEKKCQRQFKNSEFKIKIDELKWWNVSEPFCHDVEIGDLLEVQPKESIFLTTAIYENDIKIIKKSQ